MVEQGDVTPLADAADLFGADNRLRRYRLRETFTLERICRDIEADGYAVQPVLIPACAVGAPHRRDRVFIIGRRTAADTRSGRQSTSEQQGQRAGQAVQPQGRVESFDGLGGFSPASSPADTEKAGCGRWELFPTQSPVHSGNDGLSVGMDGASIPFNKWRKEALKAYGNAIVPQVMYEIFRAIEQVENERK
jgi:DNA (cytosine-5)-methyltransferase 1